MADHPWHLDALESRTLLAAFSWTNGANNPAQRFEAQGTVCNGKLYIFGGFDGAVHAMARSDVYDPVANAWTRIADMPEATTHCGQAVDGAKIYLAGGFLGNYPGPSVNFVRVYDTASNTWTNGPSLPGDRGGGGLVRLGRELHYFGGATSPAGSTDFTDFGTHWVLQLGPTDSTSDDATTWTIAADMPNPRNHLGGAVVGGKIYAIGGQHVANEVSGNQVSVNVFDPATGNWSSAADLPRPLGHITSSSFEHNGRIVVAGGVTQGGIEDAHVMEYDPASNTWVALPSIPGGREGPVSGAVGRKLIVATGEQQGFVFADTFVGELEGSWETTTPSGTMNMPVPLSEVAGGVIGRNLYVVGSGHPGTLVYDLSTNIWSPSTTLAMRPLLGDHHAAEVVNGKLYLFGGLGGGSDGKVQIYDPLSNNWTMGADMPFAAGSSSSAVINGQVYVAGGIVGASTTNQLARYNPVTNSWTTLATMLQGRNHAASATDGQRLFIFGGRGPGSGGDGSLANGFDTVQIYDPATNTWVSSETAGSTLRPLPQARGGTGKAVFVNGEFYVIGGETLDGPGATPLHVYDRVDIYDPLNNTWRLGTPMPTARHGIFPLARAERVYVAGGGIQSGGSSSSILEIYNPVLVPHVVRSEFLWQSAPLRLTITFSEDVSSSLQTSDLTLRRLPGDPPFSPTGLSYDRATNTATFTLPTPLPSPNMLGGDYRATLLAAGVADSGGNALPADVNIDFFLLAGDADHNHVINFDDYVRIDNGFNNHLTGFGNGDFNFDGKIDFDDYVLIDLAFNSQSPRRGSN
jgi:N-acetylneuraminic acid mutarotase